MPWDAACRGSMRILHHILFPVLFFILVLPVIILPPQLSGDPDEIIPTRNLMLLGEYPNDIPVVREEAGPVLTFSAEETERPAPSLNVTAPVPAGFLAPNGKMGPLAVPEPEKPMGKGWVQVSLSTSVDSPTEMIEDRQRYMASGLFNVHVYHNFAG
jgi:hypothetical protein